MTAFGKLLIFMNLIFSVVTGALIVFVFTTRTNWVSAYNDAKGKAELAEKAYKNELTSHQNDLKQKDSTVTALNSQLTALQGQLDAAREETARARQQAAEIDKNNATAVTAQGKVQAELNQIKLEREAIIKEKEQLRQMIVKVQKELDEWREKAVLADLQAKNLQQKNQNLLREYETLTVRVRDLEAAGPVSAGPGGGGRAPLSIVEPLPKSAPPNVQGKVTFVGKSGTGLAQIDIGSDSGLSVGNVLTVFKGETFKGDLMLTSVNAKSAVGKFTPARRNATIAVDDSVITSFSGTPQ
jgi:hypothetical protein